MIMLIMQLDLQSQIISTAYANRPNEHDQKSIMLGRADHALAEPKLVRGGETLIESFLKIIPAVFEGETKNEVFVRPSELLEIARRVGAFSWILDIEAADQTDLEKKDPARLSDKDARSERRGFGNQCEKAVGRAFANGIHFDSIGDGHSKRYRFTRPT